MKNTWITVLAFGVGLLAVSSATISPAEAPYRLVCYLGSWTNYRYGDGKFLIEDIDPSLCTHLVYGFAKLGIGNKIEAYDNYLDLKENYGLGAYERFNGLKKKNPDLKTLIAIGGWNEGSTKYSNMARTQATRKVFIDSCVEFLKKHGFDGLDLDWEYPAARGGGPDDKNNFAYLIKELKEIFQPHGLMLTAAVSAGQNTIDLAYDIPALGKYLDMINLMAYDFHGGWDQTTGHNAPLYGRPEESEAQKTLNVDFAVKYWLKKGAPAEKLILGMPLYGRSVTLRDPEDGGLDAPITGTGMAGEFTQEAGFVGYNEICGMMQRQKGWKVVVNKNIRAPYAVKGSQWIGYDDVNSISAKVDYLLRMKLGGGMVWSIETDDFRGKCHGQRYPLLNAIRAGLNGTRPPQHPDRNDDPEDNSIFPTSSVRSSVAWKQTTRSQTTEFVPEPRVRNLSCPKRGYFRHPNNCKMFYMCQEKGPGFLDAGYQVHLFTCGSGTVFSQKMQTCAFPYDVPECQN